MRVFQSFVKMETFRGLFALCVALLVIQIQGQQCPTEEEVIDQFNAVSSQYGLYDEKVDAVCQLTEYHHDEDEDHHDEDEDHHEDHHDEENEDGHNEQDEHADEWDDHTSQNESNSCEMIYNVCRTVILNLELTTEDCLSDHDHANDTNAPSQTLSSAKAYGYGFLMILFVSLCSLGGVFLVPLILNNSPTGKRIYEHVYSFMVAIAISALVSDAVLHLIPHAFGLHGHEEDEEDSAHAHDSESAASIDFIWKGCMVLLGMYGFYLLEFFLHTFGHDHHMHNKDTSEEFCDGDAHNHCPADDVHFTSAIPTSNRDDKDKAHEKQQSIPLQSHHDRSIEEEEEDAEHHHRDSHSCVKKIKPVAWLIIVGDAVHNIADGIALGGAISQSLSLGVSTMIALVFHEIPHEFGDFVILVKSGFHWSTALLVNFLQSLGAIFGFFIGVGVSTNSIAASNWILAVTAGLFFYIALTDLLPELVHGGGHKKPLAGCRGHKFCNWDWIIRFILINGGFFIAFAILLVLAIYEEDLNNLI